MSPELPDLVTSVCRLAFDFSSIKTLSVLELVQRSGYGRRSDEVTVERLAARLADHPDWVRAWLQYSEDKRTSSGWYVIGGEGTNFRVGFDPESPERPPMEFDDKVRACATFINVELADIAGLDARARFGRWVSRMMHG